MPLTLVTGPANSAKAGVIFDALRAGAHRNPLLVVPTAADASHYARELAAEGPVLGVAVRRFDGLAHEIAARAGVCLPVLGPVARARVVTRVAQAARDSALAASAAAPGFAHALGELFAELARALVPPARFARAVAAWRAADPEAPPEVEEAARLYRAYGRALDRLGRVDAEGFAVRALDALRTDPGVWDGRPVLFYGWDDLTPLQLDAIEALARRAGAPVTVSLPYEPGRAAFAGRAAAVEALRPLADEHVALPDAGARHYAPESAVALRHLERFLFEDDAPRVAPGDAVALLQAANERGEAEALAREVAALAARGIAPAEVAVVHRAPERLAPALEAALAARGVALDRDRRVPLANTPLGAGLLALARAAGRDGRAEDVVGWLRAPGRLGRPEPADSLEARVARRGLRRASEARRAWERELGQPALRELDALRDAAGAGPLPLMAALERAAVGLLAGGRARRAPVLDALGEDDARALAALRRALAELREVAGDEADGGGDPATVCAALARVEVGEPAPPHGGGVLLTDPLAIRARRFRAVLVAGLEEGVFPRPPAPDPFLDDDRRRALARASGLVLPLRETVAGGEEHLFYACASRPTDALRLSWKRGDEDGRPLAPSPFVDAIRRLFDPGGWERLPPPPAAPAAFRGAPRPAATGPLRSPELPATLAALAERDVVAARELEGYAQCPVKWLVSAVLRPDRVEADPEPLRRGALAHAVLESALRRLRERTGSARVVPDRLPAVLTAVDEVAGELGRRGAGGPGATGAALLRRVHADVERSLRFEAECGPGLEPERLEWSFGRAGAEHPPLELRGEAGAVRVSGRVDRVDVAPDGRAVVRDYKGRSVPGAAAWPAERRLQAPLYALAVRRLLDLEPDAVVYQPLGGRDPRPRGLVRAGADEERGGSRAYVRTDVVDPTAFEAVLADAEERAVEAAAGMRAGRVHPCPATCLPGGGCAYPSICRAAA